MLRVTGNLSIDFTNGLLGESVSMLFGMRLNLASSGSVLASAIARIGRVAKKSGVLTSFVAIRPIQLEARILPRWGDEIKTTRRTSER